MISSTQNERIKEYAKLNEKKYRDETNLFIIEGIHLVEEAKKYGIIKEILTTNPNIEGTLVSVEVMKKITNQKSVVEVCAICEKLNKKEITNKVLILDNIQDPGNIGTLIRTAVSFNFNTIVMENCADIYSSKVIRATQGAIFKLNIINAKIDTFISSLDGYKIYGTSLKNGVPLKEIKKSDKLAIILGNEGNGVRDEILDMTDKNIFIEIENMESLNVGIAGGIIMYELK
ncbi:MAG: RNA methyltransferase [Acholeplasmatales bacterium]|nr:RNA methyltransferase [Acholeplasmatales bacterium]